MKDTYTKHYSLFGFLISFLIIASLLTACASAPDVIINTRPPRTDSSSPIGTLPDVSVQKVSSGTPSVSNSPSTSANQNVKNPELILDIDENIPVTFDSQKNGFSCYFSDNYIYSFENGEECTLTVSSENESVTALGRVDLTLGKSDFNEEGIFKGVGFIVDYEFEEGCTYTLSVKIPSQSYTYVFTFDFTR